MKSLVLACVTAVAILGCNAEMVTRPEKWAVPITCAGVPNLHKVSDKLYRSAQPTAEGMTNIVALGVKTVVNLRDNHSDSDEIGYLPLKARRIEIAKALLESNLYSVAEVAMRSGFESISYFSSEFRRATGFSPKEYSSR